MRTVGKSVRQAVQRLAHRFRLLLLRLDPVAQHLLLLPIKARKVIMGIADIGWVAFNALVIYGATVYSLSLIEFPYRMPTTKVNLVWVFSIIPIAFTLLSIRILVNIRRRWIDEIDMTDAQKEM